MKIFITGIRGFLGAHLANQLSKEGHQILGIDNLFHPSSNKIPKQMWHWGDVRYYPHVSSYISNSNFTLDTNVNGTLTILEACRKFNKRLLLASSSEVYGSALTAKITEDHPLNGHSPYAATKTAADRLAYSYWVTYKLPVTIIRNFNIFGEHQSFDSYGGVIAKFTYAALKGMAPKIFGDGTQERDYMNVKDAVEAYKTCLNNKDTIGKAINFGSGTTVTINDLASMIAQEVDPTLIPEHVDPRPGEVQKLQADISLAQSFGFKPTTSFNMDLKKYIAWFRSNSL